MVAVILAAGTGSRMKAGINKAFLPVCGKEVLLHTVEAFQSSKTVTDIIVVTGECDIERSKELLKNCSKVSSVIVGGKTRQESSYIGVCAANSEFVLIHDGARALITPEDIDAVAAETVKSGAAAVGTPCVDTMKICVDGKIVSTVDRENLYKIYTPQGFNRSRLIEFHRLAAKENVAVTDDCALYEWAGESISMVVGNPQNIKLTTPEDICVAESVLSGRQ